MKKILLLAPIFVILLTQFTNCSPVATESAELSSLGDLACDANCITPTSANLKVQPNLFLGSNFNVHRGLADFNIAGDCNEGGYDYNVITWVLYDYRFNPVRTSAQAGAESACVNGRFSAYVRLDSIPGDANSRIGLNFNGERRSYTLQFEIFGMLTPKGARQIGSDSKRAVTLVPET